MRGIRESSHLFGEVLDAAVESKFTTLLGFRVSEGFKGDIFSSLWFSCIKSVRLALFD